jgi:hypothetical protein
MAKILYYDIETAPNLSYVWGHYEQNVIAHNREWYMLCVSYRWEHEKKTHVTSLVDFPAAYKADSENDYHVVKKLWDLLNEADIVIAHNGDRFDMRKANARFIAHDLGPISPVKSVDTLKEARRHFMFNSNKLDDLGAHLNLGRKVSTGGFETWAGCMRGDMKYWKLMTTYAKQDVDLLKKVYLALRPWMKTHPNLNVFNGTNGCPACGSEHLHKRGTRRTQVSVFQQYQCNDCKAYSRQRRSETTAFRPEIVL